MKKKKVTKASKRRLLLFGTLSIFIIVYFFISLSYYIMDIYHLQKEQKQLETSLILLKKDEKLLKTEIEKLKDPEYLARYARENFLYSKDGEIVIKVQESETKNVDNKETEPNYKIIFIGSLILLFIIGYVIRKSKKK